MRKKIVAGNWKMNLGLDAAMALASEISGMASAELPHGVEVILAPPFPFLFPVSGICRGNKNIFISAQNCHHEKHGAYTGEVSPFMLQSMGVTHVIIGHSERRAYSGESNELIAKKVKAALECGLVPVYCCGESKEERESGRQFDVVRTQLEKGLFISAPDTEAFIIAYEPVWAIGTGVNASPEQAQEMHAFIRSVAAGKYGAREAENVSILYGGSCNAANARAIFSQPDVDGGLIGGASLKSREFTEIIKSLPARL